MGGSGPIGLPTGSHLGQVVEKLQDYPYRGITLIAPSGPTCLVLGSLDHVKSDSLVPVQPALSQPLIRLLTGICQIRSACMAPRAPAIKVVAVGIEAPQKRINQISHC